MHAYINRPPVPITVDLKSSQTRFAPWRKLFLAMSPTAAMQVVRDFYPDGIDRERLADLKKKAFQMIRAQADFANSVEVLFETDEMGGMVKVIPKTN